jgi:hypothetical protein
MKASSTARRISFRRPWAALAAALALVFVPSATPANTPILNLGPITVANGTAAVTGTVGSEAAGDQLTINGQAIGVDAAGAFAGVVNLNGASSVSLTLSDPAGNQQTGFTIPLTLAGLGGIIPSGVLDTIQQAGLKLLEPLTNGDALTVAGGVLDKGQLAGLSVNGKDILGALGPDGSFSIQVPGTTKTITLSGTDTNGVQENILSAVHTPLSATSVSAASAVGIKITSVRYIKTGVLKTHRVRMVVTVKDRQNRLIRGAKILVQGTKAGRLAKRPKATLSGKKGTATVVLRLRNTAFGKRLFTITIAKTPTAKVQKKSSVSVPRLKHKRSHR